MNRDTICKKCNFREVQHRNLHLCAACYKQRRAKQNKPIARRWYARFKNGNTGHRYFYRGKPTPAALDDPRAAVKSLAGKAPAVARRLKAALKHAMTRLRRAAAKTI